MKAGVRKKPEIWRLLFIVFCAVAICCFSSFVLASGTDNAATVQSLNSDQIEQLKHSAEQGSAESQFELGVLFEYGRGVEQDDLQAAHWYEKSATQGFPEGLYRLAILLDNGWGQAINKERAFKLYKSAAEKGHTLAQHDVAIMYFQGSGVSKDIVQAYKWLKIADLSGNPLMAKHLKRIKRHMTFDEVEQAEFFANQWVMQ